MKAHGDLYTESRTKKALYALLIACVVLYALFLVWALWLKLSDESQILTNFKNISNLTERERWLVDGFLFEEPEFFVQQNLEILLNCFVLAPFGIALSLLTRGKHIWAHVLFCFFFSLGIELIQRFTLFGGFSFVDLTANTLGCLVGFLLYKLIFSRVSDKALAVTVGVCVLFLSAALAYATFSIIEIKDTLLALFRSL